MKLKDKNGHNEPREGEMSSVPAVEESGFNLQQYFQLLWKHKWLILSMLVVMVGMVAVWTYSQTKIYQATTTVILERRAPQVLGKDVGEVVDLSMGNYWSNKEYMKTQESVITSKALARRVAERLSLHNNPSFWGKKSDGEEVKGRGIKTKRTLAMAANALGAMVRATVVRDSNIIQISAEHLDPEMAAMLANTVADAYLEQNVDYKLASTAGAVKWLANQLDDLKKELEKAEMNLYQFKKDNNIVSVSLEDKQSLIMRRIEKLNDALTELHMKRMALEAERKQIKRVLTQDPMDMSVGPVMENLAIQNLKTTYLKQLQEYRALLETYGELYPLVKKKKAEMDSARADLNREVKNVLATVESRFQEVRDNETALAAMLQEDKDEALELNKREVSYKRLKRNQENTVNLYSMVLTRLKESDLSAQNRVNNIRILDRAVAPAGFVRPRIQLNLLAGAFLGLLLGIGLAFLVEMLDTSIKSQEDVERIPGLTYLGMVPRIPGAVHTVKGRRPDPNPEMDLIVHRNSKSAVAESCRAIRTNLMFASPDISLKRVLITSAGPREGKTTSAVSLAITMAQAGSRVLLLDTDMRRPRMHKVFTVPGGEGITSVLLGDDRIEDVIKATEVPNLYLLPCGPTPPNPAEICQSERFKRLLDELSERFERVILDSPPVMVVTDAAVLSTLADGVLVVARTGTTTKVAIKEATRQLLDVSANMLGCILNDMDLEKRGYGYYRYRRYGYSRYGYGSYRYGYGQYGEKEEEATS